MGKLSVTQPPKHMPDAALNQGSPVSTTLYTVLDLTKNVRIISIQTSDTWATSQPTPLEIIVTIDGNVLIFTMVNPVSGTSYEAQMTEPFNEAGQLLVAGGTYSRSRAFLLEGRSVKIEARITWAGTTGQTLVARVKYAKY